MDTPTPLTSAALQVLLALSSGPRHGYAVMQEAHMGPGTLYGTIGRLLTAGLVAEVDGEDPRRRLYRLTEKGEGQLTQELRRLEAIVRLPSAQKLLRGGLA